MIGGIPVAHGFPGFRQAVPAGPPCAGILRIRGEKLTGTNALTPAPDHAARSTAEPYEALRERL